MIIKITYRLKNGIVGEIITTGDSIEKTAKEVIAFISESCPCTLVKIEILE